MPLVKLAAGGLLSFGYRRAGPVLKYGQPHAEPRLARVRHLTPPRPVPEGALPARSARRAAALLALALACAGAPAAGLAPGDTVPDTLAQRLLACTACHGQDGRASNQGYLPRIAGKPAGYLYNQMQNFRQGRRSHAAMTRLLDTLSPGYMQEIAQHFSSLDLPYPAPPPPVDNPATLARGRALVQHGDPAAGLPACVACHGRTLAGVAPAVPGLLGLPRDYLIGQLGAWQTGLRHAAAPDCMARVAQGLSSADVGAMAGWLAQQPVSPGTKAEPAAAMPREAWPLPCGSVPR